MTAKPGADEASQGRDQRTVALGGGLRVPYPRPRDEAATKVGKGNRRKDTKPEVALRSALHRRGLRFRKDYPIRVEGRRPIRPDVVFTRARVAVFVDGCFWHGCPDHQVVPKSNPDYWIPKLRRNVERDREVTDALEADGWAVVHIWEHDEVAEAAELIEQVVGARTTRRAAPGTRARGATPGTADRDRPPHPAR